VRQIFPAAAAAPEIALAAPGDRRPEAEAAVAALARLYAYPAAATARAAPSETAIAAPWLRANMIASVDGAASLNGLSGGLSGAADHLVFSVLRSLADVILVGAGTVRAEKYHPVGPGEIWPELRDGRAPIPPIAVVTRSLAMDLDGPLLSAPAGPGRTIVLTTQAAPAARRDAAARHADVVVTGPDDVSPAAAVSALAARGYRRVLVEGGPSLLGQIADAGLLDEICLTFSPVLAGGTGGRILSQAQEGQPGVRPETGGPGAWPGLPDALRLAHVLEDNGSLLCRYLRDAG
jgi:riboflavin biosynthesis pyrimidine reductase